MATSGKLVLTRPAAQVSKELLARDDVSSFPLLEIEANRISPSEQGYIENLDEYAAVIFVSGNAVRHGLGLFEQRWPQWPVGVDWLTMGKQSQQAAEHFGLALSIPHDGFDSEAVLRMPQLQSSNINEKKVLVVRGQQGRTLLGDSLSERGAEVHYLQCYNRRCPDYTDQQIQLALSDDIGAIQINSGEVLQHLCDLQKRVQLDMKQVPLLLISQRVSDIAKAQDFTQRYVLEDASDQALLALWQQIKK